MLVRKDDLVTSLKDAVTAELAARGTTFGPLAASLRQQRQAILAGFTDVGYNVLLPLAEQEAIRAEMDPDGALTQ